MPFPNEHAARIQEPKKFKFFRRTKGGKLFNRVEVPSTVSVIWGKQTDSDNDLNDPLIPQALRFDKDNWTEKQAVDWMFKNDLKPISFEPASQSNSKRKLFGSHEDIKALIEEALTDALELFGGDVDDDIEYIDVLAVFDDHVFIERSGTHNPIFYKVFYSIESKDDTTKIGFSESEEIILEDFTEEEIEDFADDSPEKLAQIARSKKYGISIIEGKNITKPLEYANISDEQFGDPVNYTYPINSANVISARQYFNHDNQQENGGYSDEDWSIIGRRISKASGEDYEYTSKKVSPKPRVKTFVEVEIIK